jgi:hypothetical protein
LAPFVARGKQDDEFAFGMDWAEVYSKSAPLTPKGAAPEEG